MTRLELAFAHLHRGQFDAAVDLLVQEMATGNPEAAHQLARLHLYGMLEACDSVLARAWLDTAVAAEHAPARYTRAVIEAGEPDGRWLTDLRAASRAGHPLAWRSLGLLYGGQEDAASQQAAITLLGWAAIAGDRVAQGLCREAGAPPTATGPGPDALADAHAALPPLDATHAARLLPALTADEDWRLQPDALGPWDAAYLRHLATPLLSPSQAVDPASGEGRRLRLRTSDDAPIDPLLEDVAMRLLQRRLCTLAGLPTINAEPMVVLRYRPGQEYRLHRDLLPPSTLADPRQGRGGQRAMTVIAYLNAVPSGGETDFPKRGVRVAPRPGAALVFRNLCADGTPDEESLHAGLPVQQGEKWIATLWIRTGAVRGF